MIAMTTESDTALSDNALKAAFRTARVARQDVAAVLERAETLARHARDVASNKAEILQRATVAAAQNEFVDSALSLERTRRDAEVVSDAAARAAKSAQAVVTSRREELAAADGRVRQALSSIKAARLDSIAARLKALRAEERKLAFLLSHARMQGISTPASEGALDSPPARPTSSVTMPNPGLVVDINTALGNPAEFEAARRDWVEFDAAVVRDNAEAGEQEHVR
jgi:hypothetical protein